ncbi:hypothetical protein TNCV_4746871 [Trichonephila clavipes]|nr:hypothetical protein TNCV_4746871 [Trichonephila clavipes]
MSKPKMPESDYVRLKNTMEQIQQLYDTIGGYDKLLSDPELGNMVVQYKKESMERMELLVSKLRTVPPCMKPDCPDHIPLTKLKNKSNKKDKFKKRKAKNESADDFAFPNKIARPFSLNKTEELIETQNNFENFTQDVELSLAPENEIVIPKPKTPSPVMLKIRKL